jgi:hypothetical protein
LNNFVHFIFNLGGVNMDLGIKGKWALVGGASKGLGWGCARALALEGVNVVMWHAALKP